jgi:hypothetical protein
VAWERARQQQVDVATFDIGGKFGRRKCHEQRDRQHHHGMKETKTHEPLKGEKERQRGAELTLDEGRGHLRHEAECLRFLLLSRDQDQRELQPDQQHQQTRKDAGDADQRSADQAGKGRHCREPE